MISRAGSEIEPQHGHCVIRTRSHVLSAHTIKALDQVWRLIIGLGIVPAIVALYFRLTIPETPRFTMDIDRNVLQASQDIDAVMNNRDFHADEEAVLARGEAPKASRRDFMTHFGQWRNGKVLFGTAFTWFALDVCAPATC